MRHIFIAALAASVLAAPLAYAKDMHRAPSVHHDVQKYPKGWGPHRGPDRAGYHHGYQGYHERRPGYRRGSDGLWYPAAAFAVGAILGGALAH
ncbi:MAG TPA: hypothetical protein VGC14_05875 [Rhizobium sp.]